MRRSFITALILVVAAASFACTRPEAQPSANGTDAASLTLASSSARPASSGDATAPKAARAAHAADDGGLRAETVDEAENRRRYRAAMTNGRVATIQHKYAAAIGAFDGALAAKKNDPRALAEKAYARLMSGKELDLARSDLEMAAANAKDPRLLSQIWFNLGLVEDDLHESDNAQVDYWMADHVFPSPAARSKLHNKKLCPIRVDRSFKAAYPEKTRVQAPGWLALWKELPSTSWDDDDVPKTDDAARKALIGKDVPAADLKFPLVVVAGHAGAARAAFVVGKSEAGLNAVAVGADVGGRCPGEVTFEVVGTRGTLVHVNGRETPEGGYSYMCTHEDAGVDGPVGPCTDAEFANDGTPVQSFCAGGTATERDVVIDIARGTVLVALERPYTENNALRDPGSGAGRRGAITATLGDRGLALAGLDCAGTTIGLIAPADAGAPH